MSVCMCIHISMTVNIHTSFTVNSYMLNVLEIECSMIIHFIHAAETDKQTKI